MTPDSSPTATTSSTSGLLHRNRSKSLSVHSYFRVAPPPAPRTPRNQADSIIGRVSRSAEFVLAACSAPPRRCSSPTRRGMAKPLASEWDESENEARLGRDGEGDSHKSGELSSVHKRVLMMLPF